MQADPDLLQGAKGQTVCICTQCGTCIIGLQSKKFDYTMCASSNAFLNINHSLVLWSTGSILTQLNSAFRKMFCAR